MRPNLGRACLAGFIATIAITLMMYCVAPLLNGGSLDVAGMVGGLLGGSWLAGVVGHFVLGTLVLPVFYVLFAYRWLAGAPEWRGAQWGVALWLVAQVIVMPIAGGGFFSSQAGGLTTAAISLLGHVIYGLTLGELCGGPRGEARDLRRAHHRPSMRPVG